MSKPELKQRLELRIQQLAVSEAEMLDELKGKKVVLYADASPYFGTLAEHGTNFIQLVNLAKLRFGGKDLIQYVKTGKNPFAENPEQQKYKYKLFNKTNVSEIFAVEDCE